MLQIEKGTQAHTNFFHLFRVLWPDEEASKATYPIVGTDSIQLLPNITVHVWHTWKDNHEEAWVRFTKADKSFTYWLNAYWAKLLMNSKIVELSEDILVDLRRAPYEIPLSYLEPVPQPGYDDITQEEFRALATLPGKLRERMEKNLLEITRKADRFVKAAECRDHELHMTFNIVGEDKLTFALRFDKVYPKLPKEGFQLGLGTELAHDIAPDDTESLKVMNRLKILQRTINKDIVTYRTIGQFGPAATELFNKEVRTLLFAATHFYKRLYPFDGVHGKPEIERVANEILDALYSGKRRLQATGELKMGDNIGLDVNSWIVWIYPFDGSEPVRCEDPQLNFKEIILESYLESFTNVLMGYLMDLQMHDVIRPYVHLVKADAADGHAIGSIRQA